MKILLLLSFVGLGLANPLDVSYDLSKVRPIIDTPEFQARFPHVKFADPFTRITGGSEATPNQFPYQAALFINGASFCGASLISSNYAMTAAHCVDRLVTGRLIFGAHLHSTPEPTQVIVDFVTSDVTVHAGWNSQLIANDIAVIRLPTPVVFTNEIRAVALPSRSQANTDFTDYSAIVSGWGRASDASGSISSELRYVDVPIISNAECSGSFTIIQDSNICTSGAGGRSPCNGDSGGPLTIAAFGGIQVGVVSFGSSAGCELGHPGAFARVTSFMDFIEEFTDVVFAN